MTPSLSRDLHIQSELHVKLVEHLRHLMLMSQTAMSDRHQAWAKMEDQFLAYMPEQELDAARRGLRSNLGKPQYTTIEVPYSYAMMLTAHTYITSVFFGRDPVQQVQGRHGEGQMQEQSVEALLDYQMQVGRNLPPYYIWFHDALRYGLGIIGYYWDKEQIRTAAYVMEQKTILGVPVGVPKKVMKEQTVTGYEGVRMYNVRPQDWITDPRVTFAKFQDGEFCGRYLEQSWNDLVSDGRDGNYINLEELKKSGPNAAHGLRVVGSSQMVVPGQSQQLQNANNNELDRGNFPLWEMYVRLIPYDWGLGNSKLPEKWVFLVANGDVIISAKPLGYFHDKYPFEVLESEIGGHAMHNRSMLEVLKPMNDVLTWLVNSHFYNVRKSLNDQFVVDPSRVVIKDVSDPNPGKLIRLRPEAYGTDVRAALSQLQVADVTRSHMSDFNMVAEMMQRVGGVNDSLMGMVNSGRKSATEVRTSTTFGVNRLKTVSEYFSAMGFGPMTQQIIQTTQQMYDNERVFRIAGTAAQIAEPYRKVTPDDIAGFYDFVGVDGTMPVDRMAQVNLWQTMMGQLGQMPQIAGQYDFGKIFGYVAQLAGLKNIGQFKIQVVPDEQAAQSAQAGNSVPLKQPATTTSGMPALDQMQGQGPML